MNFTSITILLKFPGRSTKIMNLVVSQENIHKYSQVVGYWAFWVHHHAMVINPSFITVIKTIIYTKILLMVASAEKITIITRDECFPKMPKNGILDGYPLPWKSPVPWMTQGALPWGGEMLSPGLGSPIVRQGSSRVVLPQPEGPMMATKRPDSKRPEMGSLARDLQICRSLVKHFVWMNQFLNISNSALQMQRQKMCPISLLRRCGWINISMFLKKQSSIILATCR